MKKRWIILMAILVVISVMGLFALSNPNCGLLIQM